MLREFLRFINGASEVPHEKTKQPKRPPALLAVLFFSRCFFIYVAMSLSLGAISHRNGRAALCSQIYSTFIGQVKRLHVEADDHVKAEVLGEMDLLDIDSRFRAQDAALKRPRLN